MDASIREYQAADETDVLDLSLRAWAPNFASMEHVLGPEICTRLHGEDWRAYQSKSVKNVLADPVIPVWVGEDAHGNVVGFVAATVVDAAQGVGEIVMGLSIPAHQVEGLAPH